MKCSGVSPYSVCGVCTACRVNYASSWAVRGSHERQLHDYACSITLTYSNDHVPWSGLQKKHLQDFFKRFRQQLVRDSKKGVKRASYNFRYMACGEYGDLQGRRDSGHPHYHAVLFGFDFLDKYKWRKGKLGHQLYRSPFLEELWPFGNCEIGGAEDEMINYVSSYILKKVNGDLAKTHYAASITCAEQGNVFNFLRSPEFFLSSRRPAIALKFLEQYWDDMFSRDELVLAGKVRPIPAYYLNKLRDRSEIFYRMIKRDRAFDKVDRQTRVWTTDRRDLTEVKRAIKVNNEARMGLYSKL